jgi:hypothetical protein
MSFWARAALFSALILLSHGEAFAAKGDVCSFKDAAGNLQLEKMEVYQLHQLYEVYRKFDIDCDGKLGPSEIKAFEASQAEARDSWKRYGKLVQDTNGTIALDENGDTKSPLFASTEPTKGPLTGWVWLLRDSFEGIRAFSAVKEVKEASGAQFGFAQDDVANNRSRSAKGVAALAYRWYEMDVPRGDDPYVSAVAFAPSISFNRVTSSSAKVKQVDVLGFGATGEVAVNRLLDSMHLLRLRGALNTSFEGDSKSWSATFEWQPISDKFGLGTPHRLTDMFTWEIAPLLRTQYTEKLGDNVTDPLFLEREQVLRAGPVVALTIAVEKGDPDVPKWYEGISLNASYQNLFDLDTGSDYPLSTVSLNFPIDREGHFGVKIAYTDGRVEETGQRIDQTTIGLSAKW